MFIKRLFDIAASIVLLIVLSPLLVLIAGLVLFSSPGPILFVQDRVGKDGRVFRMFKFRTMVRDAAASIHRAYYEALVNGTAEAIEGRFKLVNDPRITSMGRILRKCSADELPQLLNVLRGDMSLVGPRPPIPYEVELYTPRERARFAVTPGLTGLWQVSGRSLLGFEAMVQLDLLYIQQWSLWFDLLILLRTPLAVLTARGAD
jgi:lipopolysaccharide/colanic/teichoic acid biosynthesis glycosyltransferase